MDKTNDFFFFCFFFSSSQNFVRSFVRSFVNKRYGETRECADREENVDSKRDDVVVERSEIQTTRDNKGVEWKTFGKSIEMNDKKLKGL